MGLTFSSPNDGKEQLNVRKNFLKDDDLFFAINFKSEKRKVNNVYIH